MDNNKEYGLSDLIHVLDILLGFITNGSRRRQFERFNIILYWLSVYNGKKLNRHQLNVRVGNKLVWTKTDVSVMCHDLEISRYKADKVLQDISEHPVLGNVFQILLKEEFQNMVEHGCTPEKEYQETLNTRYRERNDRAME